MGPPRFHSSDFYSRQSQTQKWSERARGYSVHSHLFQNLEADTRYEVIVQSQNQFGWSEPTNPFIFSTRFQDYSPLNMASHPSFRGGLTSNSNICISSISKYFMLLLLLMH